MNDIRVNQFKYRSDNLMEECYNAGYEDGYIQGCEDKNDGRVITDAMMCIDANEKIRRKLFELIKDERRAEGDYTEFGRGILASCDIIEQFFAEIRENTVYDRRKR